MKQQVAKEPSKNVLAKKNFAKKSCKKKKFAKKILQKNLAKSRKRNIPLNFLKGTFEPSKRNVLGRFQSFILQ